MKKAGFECKGTRFEEILRNYGYSKKQFYGTIIPKYYALFEKYSPYSDFIPFEIYRKRAELDYDKAESSISRLYTLYSGNLSGLNILDVGCGSINSKDNFFVDGYSELYEPWFCRLLSDFNGLFGLDMTIIGVDLDYNNYENFVSETMNFAVDDVVLDYITSLGLLGRVDFVNSAWIKDSPAFLRSGASMAELEAQIERILKPDGIYLQLEL